ncbi:hypothetical protein [Candidatus Palauibacter sp.]|uniref:hypothetical protein n=1 Tax=Candidatus Palauibacter sp. TaxID=3101350 RepID=UPI003B02A0AB
MAEHGADGNGDTGDGRPQLRMWDDAGKETVVGTLDDAGDRWKVVVIVEPLAADLARGRLSFRLGDERHDTAPVLLEETATSVVQRAAELPDATLRQLLTSARR